MAEFAIPLLDSMLATLAAEPATGESYPSGGTVAALVAALASSLAADAADWSREEWEEAGGARAQAQALCRRATDLAARNAAAYSVAVEALAERERERDAAGGGAGDERRDWRLGTAVREAAGPPLALTAAAADIAGLAALIAGHGSPDVRPDAVVAALLAAAAARAAARLVEINLVVGRDQPLAAQARQFAELAAAAAASAESAA